MLKQTCDTKWSKSFYFKKKIQINKQNRRKWNNSSNQISENGNDAFSEFFNLFAGVQTNFNRFNYKNRVYGNYQNRFSKNDVKPVRFQIEKKFDSFSFKKPYFKNKIKIKIKIETNNKFTLLIKKITSKLIIIIQKMFMKKMMKTNSTNLLLKNFQPIWLNSKFFFHFSRSHRCRMCKIIFDFNKKLHKHVRIECINFIFFSYWYEIFFNQSKNEFQYSKT